MYLEWKIIVDGFWVNSKIAKVEFRPFLFLKLLVEESKKATLTVSTYGGPIPIHFDLLIQCVWKCVSVCDGVARRYCAHMGSVLALSSGAANGTWPFSPDTPPSRWDTHPAHWDRPPRWERRDGRLPNPGSFHSLHRSCKGICHHRRPLITSSFITQRAANTCLKRITGVYWYAFI